jgi:hypothetical protein
VIRLKVRTGGITPLKKTFYLSAWLFGSISGLSTIPPDIGGTKKNAFYKMLAVNAD